ncbi:puromycin-sensitive aminopeptidase-like proteinmetallo-peptidase Clan MA(E) Family M1 [Leptomonas pyrrhocoris]|uniref:Puromycin-sensitive aminopeptidase-like proteinmetallo-peptidase Clan MA(E) Family M1 n=1 Tax=Leptomonas pyrrhocoris TaxID=157538 RepID=A0A0M9FTP5_LEPPY|nr:puromycin-sensitive aminopeptidase-like proteinmetallo-peptidase Clan MA(E) Family M1 [Leptomonas pyrrhocoris]KPA75666.1 puromycin-sensitive aminopeptidase-like proteinmetallo-peptidase Clan MA(E) Family M1 [Leptomonas pyrrhocoris]|eukprot:XP_015654105.1 puromycin-sensitive aminopeptidase-like proteinmetallo-peptidase Clan MA(E) Family M1 [Leptomonas pyrrhocoris]
MAHSNAQASLAEAVSAWDAMGSPTFRLPPHVVPQHYAIEFQPNTTLSTFVGAAYITLRVAVAPAAPLTHLVLHTLDLTLEKVSIRVFVPTEARTLLSGSGLHPSQHRTAVAPQKRLYGDGEGGCIPCASLRRSAVSETTQLLFDAPLPSAVGDLFVLLIERFNGRIRVSPYMTGLYHSSPTDPTVISTHLEPTDARRLFPCFDEPAIQATFQLSVVTDAASTVISNTEVEADIPLSVLPYCGKVARSINSNAEEEDAKNGKAAASSIAGLLSEEQAPANASFSSVGSTSAAAATMPWHCVRFEPTPPLHTCVIGFHVGRYTILEQRTRLSRVLCRVVLPHTEQSSSGWFALDLATKALDFFEEFFNVPLPLKKLDVVAVEKFAVLGMENWGLINLHKDYLIVTGSTPLERRQRITRLIGHETCHQWFGNWITIEWWNCLWLKEGMCRYLEYFFVNAIFPSWGLWNEFQAMIMNDALQADADPLKTHPVDSCNAAPRHIFGSFDLISYGKGACVLRMMVSIIGTEWLRRATHLLMIRFANRSFNANDLGDCIVATADEHSSKEAQEQHAKGISYALKMVEAVSHPYLYIQQIPNEGYNITQYVPPSKQHGLLVEYWQSQRHKLGSPAIDLFSVPSHVSFQWRPEETLTRVSKPFALPLRSAGWHRGGHGSVRLIFVEDAEHFVPLLATATAAAPVSSFYSPASKTGGHAGPSAFFASPTLSKSGEQEASTSPRSPTSPFHRVFYFNHGGCGFYHCDYDMATWRQLFEFVAAFSDDERMAITLHFINTAKAQLGHQPDTVGDRCTLFFEWLLRLTTTPGAMNSFLWDIVTGALTHIVHLVQQYYCQSVVKAFVNGLYLPLQKRCALSFFAQEKTVSFQSSIHLSRHLVLRILQLLCLCENPEVMDEADETAQWALARVVPLADSPYHAAMGGSGNGSGGPGITTTSAAAAAPLSADTLSPHSIGLRASAATTQLATAPLGVPARRSSQTDLGGAGGSCGTPASAATAPKSSPVKATPAQGHLLTGSFTGSAARALPPPQLSSTPHGNADHGPGSNVTNLFNSFGGPPSTTDWAGVKNSSIASYPYQRAAELNLTDASHVKAGVIALAHLASQGRTEHWVAAAAVAAEVLEIDTDALQRLSGIAVPSVRLSGLDRSSRADYLRLVLPAVFSFDREQLFPFMVEIFQSVSFITVESVEALYRNSRFLLHLISHGLLTNRSVLHFIVTTGAEICGNGFVVAQLKALAQGTSSNNDSVQSSVEMFKEVEFADCTVPAPGNGDGSTPPSTASCTLLPTSQCTSSSVSAAPSSATERSALRLQFPAVASALDLMESNCVWMDYCCWHYDHFLREQRQGQVWRPTPSEASWSMQVSTLAGDELDDGPESFGGVSI